MAIEIVDLPIENSDFPSFFCRFARPGIPFTLAPPGLLELPWHRSDTETMAEDVPLLLGIYGFGPENVGLIFPMK